MITRQAVREIQRRALAMPLLGNSAIDRQPQPIPCTVGPYRGLVSVQINM